VLYELLDGAAARGPMRAAAVKLLKSIRQSPQWTLVRVTEEHVRKGESLYFSRMDKV